MHLGKYVAATTLCVAVPGWGNLVQRGEEEEEMGGERKKAGKMEDVFFFTFFFQTFFSFSCDAVDSSPALN